MSSSAHAAVITGTLAGGGNANVPGVGTANPVLDSTSVLFSTVGQTGQFIEPSSVSIPVDIPLTGAGVPANGSTSFTFPSIAGFLTIDVTQTPPGAGPVVVDIAGGNALGVNIGGTTQYSLLTTATFLEPNGNPNAVGTLGITFTRSQTGAGVAQTYSFSLEKTSQTVPEPSSLALLGLAVGGLAFARRPRQGRPAGWA